jgi:hypothetical protein
VLQQCASGRSTSTNRSNRMSWHGSPATHHETRRRTGHSPGQITRQCRATRIAEPEAVAPMRSVGDARSRGSAHALLGALSRARRSSRSPSHGLVAEDSPLASCGAPVTGQDISSRTTTAPEPATLVFVQRAPRRHHFVEEPIDPMRESSGRVAREFSKSAISDRVCQMDPRGVVTSMFEMGDLRSTCQT